MPEKIIFTEEQIKEIIRLYKEKLFSCKKIGCIFNCSSPVINKVLRDNNVNINLKYRINLLYSQGKMKSWNKGLGREETLSHYKDGKVWNKGLTKEDPRVRKYALSEGSKKTQFKKGDESPIKGRKFEDFYGKDRAGEIIKKSSDSIKRLYKNGREPHNKNKNKDNYPILAYTGRKISKILTGRPGNRWSDESKRKFSEKKKGIPKPKELCERWSKTRKEMIANGSDKIKILGRDIEPPYNNPSTEMKIRGFLADMEIFYIPHFYFKISENFQCDIFIPKFSLIIECDGDYTHCNPLKYDENFIRYPKTDKMTAKDIWARDKRRTNELENLGFKVLRLWERDIRKMRLNNFKEIMNNYNPESPQISLSQSS